MMQQLAMRENENHFVNIKEADEHHHHFDFEQETKYLKTFSEDCSDLYKDFVTNAFVDIDFS